MTIPYREYVNYMLRVYFARGRTNRTRADSLNQSACEKILREMRDEEVELLKVVYRRADSNNVGSAVRFCADQTGEQVQTVWNLVNLTAKNIARERGLI